MLGRSPPAVEGRDSRAGGVTVAPGLFHLKTTDQPGLGAPVGDLQGFRLTAQVVPRNCQSRLVGPQLDVIQGHFGHQTDPGRPHVCQAGLKIRLRRLKGPSGTAKYVGLPARVKTSAVKGLICTQGSAAGHARRRADRWKPVGRCHIPIGAGRPQGGAGAAQIRVCSQGIFNQAVELRIGQLLPPARELVPRFGNHFHGRRCLPSCRNRRFRHPVIRTHAGARTKHTCQRKHHQPPSRSQ